MANDYNAMEKADFSDFIQPEILTRIFDDPNRTPLASKIFKNISVGLNGARVPVLSGKPAVGFVDELGLKPLATTTYGKVDITPRKLSCVIPMSYELYKIDPAKFEENLVRDVQNAMAEKLDQYLMETVYTATTTASVTPIEFDPDDPYKVATDIENTIYTAGKNMNFYAFDREILSDFDSAKDLQGRPLFNEYGLSKEANFANQSFYDVEGDLIRYPAIFRQGIKYTTSDATPKTVLGFAGDRNKGVNATLNFEMPKKIAVYETEDGVVAAEQRNIIPILFEAWCGIQIADPKAFVPVVAGTTTKIKKVEAKKAETK